LLVEDNEINQQIAVELMEEKGLKVTVANNGQEALDILEEVYQQENPPFEIIFMDLQMPVMDRYEASKRIRADQRLGDMTLVAITAHAMIEERERGMNDHVSKPIDPEILFSTIKRCCSGFKAVSSDNEEKVETTPDELVDVADAKAITSLEHASLITPTLKGAAGNLGMVRLFDIASRLELELNDPSQRKLVEATKLELEQYIGPFFRQVCEGLGRLYPSEIRNNLDDDSVALILQLDRLLYEFDASAIEFLDEHYLRFNTLLKTAIEIAFSRQEKWDGSGYPEGMSGYNISLSARLMAIADVYDALISERVYKPAYSHERAVGIIKEGSGSHFEPLLVDTFLAIEQKFREVALTFRDEGFDVDSFNLKASGDE
jgi:response regulator RpfG family c-di-GMP phosphodiesterase